MNPDVENILATKKEERHRIYNEALREDSEQLAPSLKSARQTLADFQSKTKEAISLANEATRVENDDVQKLAAEIHNLCVTVPARLNAAIAEAQEPMVPDFPAERQARIASIMFNLKPGDVGALLNRRVAELRELLATLAKTQRTNATAEIPAAPAKLKSARVVVESSYKVLS